MAFQKRKAIGVFGGRIFNQIPMQFINILRKAGVEKDYYIIAFSSDLYAEAYDDGVKGEENLFDLAQNIDVSALIILTETLNHSRYLQRIVEIGHSKNIPVFSVDGRMEGCYNLEMEYHDGFEKLVRHIVEEHGCRRVNMLAGFKDNELSDARVHAYKKVLEENGIPFEQERLAYGDFWDRPARAAMHKFFDAEVEFPEAIVCANDSMAVTACSVLNEKGLQVPEDVIVTGFDGTKDGKYHFPKLTTCGPDYEGAVAFILQEIERAQAEGTVCPCDYTIYFTLDKDQSCGCQPKVTRDINFVVSSLARDVGDCAWHNIAMNNMVRSLVYKRKMMDIADQMPEYINLWKDGFRFACLKSDMVHSHELTEEFAEMTTILREKDGEFEEPGQTFDAAEFLPGMDELMQKGSDIDTLVVRMLNLGNRVFGYTVEGMQDLDDRRLQRCNEFAMFLGFSVDTVLHNYQVHRMNENLSRAYNKISSLYILDPMTSIFNRRGFSQKMEELLEQEENFGKHLYLFSIDMDGLKKINDTYGHSEGDFAITALSKAIVKVGGANSICARFGGDEFVCAILENESKEHSAEEFSEKLSECIEATSGVHTKPYPIGASVGMYSAILTEGLDIEGMIQNSDRLMYENKVARKKQRMD